MNTHKTPADDRISVLNVDPARIEIGSSLGASLSPEQLHALRCAFLRCLSEDFEVDLDEGEIWELSQDVDWSHKPSSDGSLLSSIGISFITSEGKLPGPQNTVVFEGSSFIPSRVILTRPFVLKGEWIASPLDYAAANHFTTKDSAVDLVSGLKALEAYSTIYKGGEGLGLNGWFVTEMFTHAPLATVEHMLPKTPRMGKPLRHRQVCMASARSDACAMLALIQQHGWCLEDRDHEGDTPLMHMAMKGNAAAVSALLEAGADVAAVNNGAEDVWGVVQRRKRFGLAPETQAMDQALAIIHAWNARQAAHACLSALSSPIDPSPR